MSPILRIRVARDAAGRTYVRDTVTGRVAGPYRCPEHAFATARRINRALTVAQRGTA